jgi:predicted HTH domain antitoxin
MASRTLTFDLPEEIVALVGSPDAAAAKARLALVLDLLREGAISQGRAATILGITRWDILDLMATHAIPSGPQSAEELQREVETALRFIDRR